MSSHALYGGEWIRIRNLMNRRFKGGPCEICNDERINMVWYSIKTGKVRCFKCFDAESGNIKRKREQWLIQMLRLMNEPQQ
jgi:hypothetical protein